MEQGIFYPMGNFWAGVDKEGRRLLEVGKGVDDRGLEGTQSLSESIIVDHIPVKEEEGTRWLPVSITGGVSSEKNSVGNFNSVWCFERWLWDLGKDQNEVVVILSSEKFFVTFLTHWDRRMAYQPLSETNELHVLESSGVEELSSIE
ncbi:hypothetical protein TorRG33x02_186020 [Trema orientale]|uniref:Uncharacterized protein n=1 Tax=Trema orientale TaxID=63057 RepID=A0A2P5EJ74_TREOI|nr:hypothetical protein TorRG33x02_186020 [Trema orientale]